MNSLDPWRVMLSSPPGEQMVVPAPYYGHPFYRNVPSWIHYGDNGTRRQLFDGAFVGAELPAAAPGTERRGLLADVAPIVAPATGGITVRKELDERQVLHVEICVDGKCYKTSMDLAPAIEMVMAKFARWHEGMHARAATPTTVAGSIDDAIGVVTDAMVGAMLEHHVDTMTSGWLDDIGGAIGGTLRSLKPMIASVATGVATAYGGPAAGAAAGKLVPMVTDLQASLLDPKKDPKKAAQTKQAIQRVNQVAATDPLAATALQAAQKAVVNTAVAYHVNQTATKAAAGDPQAQQDISHVVQQAEKGDPAAQSTADVIASTFAKTLVDRVQHSEWAAKLWEQFMGRGSATVSGWPWYSIGAY